MIIDQIDMVVVFVIIIFVSFLLVASRSSRGNATPDLQSSRNNNAIRKHEHELPEPLLDVYPIYTIKQGRNGETDSEFSGTGFLIADGILVTCWHVVIDDLQRNEYYAVITQTGERAIFPLTEITRHPHKADLAKALVNIRSRFGFELADEDPSIGTSVSYFGYLPVPVFESRPQTSVGDSIIEAVVSYFDNPYDQSSPPPPSYRFSSKAYRGESGSPVIDATSQKLIGMIWGQEWAQEQKGINEILDDADGNGDRLLGIGEDQGGTAYTTVALASLMNETATID